MTNEWPLSYKLRLRASELETLGVSVHPRKPDGTDKKKPTIGQRILISLSVGSMLKIHSIQLRDHLSELTRGTANAVERKAVHKRGMDIAFSIEQLSRNASYSTEGRLAAATELQDISERLVEYADVVENMEGAA